MHGGVMRGFAQVYGDPDSPLWLPDGSHPGILMPTTSSDARSKMQITFSVGPAGKPCMDVDFDIRGRMTFQGSHGATRHTTHYRAEFDEEGTPTGSGPRAASEAIAHGPGPQHGEPYPGKPLRIRDQYCPSRQSDSPGARAHATKPRRREYTLVLHIGTLAADYGAAEAH